MRLHGRDAAYLALLAEYVQVVGHKDNADDVTREWIRFLEITGQRTPHSGGGPTGPNLEKDGASWRIFNGPPNLCRWIYGAGPFCLAVRNYNDGWIEGRRVALESILGEKVPREPS